MRKLKKLIPEPLLSLYHLALAFVGALLYQYPSRSIVVIGVTGTKGKSSTAEYVNAIFEAAGHTTAVAGSIRIKVGDVSEPNAGRSMPGRFFLQRFLRRAVDAQCDVAIIEMTSEGARQHRHRAIDLDALIFTNLAPEHIESHGSLEKYADAKYSIGMQLARSAKRPRAMIANANDAQSPRYLALPVEAAVGFSLSKQMPWSTSENGGHFTYEGIDIRVHLPGEFSLNNALAAAEVAHALGIDAAMIKKGIENVTRIPGRAEEIDAGQNFKVVVDYAHTPDSLEALYKAYGNMRKICIVSSTGGGRDTWKRPVMGTVADTYCDLVIVTDEDPYDEDPRAIMEAVASGMKRAPLIIADRRAAFAHAFENAREGDAVLITGKGTDAYIHGANGTNTPWSDAEVAREELAKLAHKITQ